MRSESGFAGNNLWSRMLMDADVHNQEIQEDNMNVEMVAQMFSNYRRNVKFHLEGMFPFRFGYYHLVMDTASPSTWKHCITVFLFRPSFYPTWFHLCTSRCWSFKEKGWMSSGFLHML